MTAQCLSQLESLSALVDGETTPQETAQLELHLSQCADCRAAYAAMTGVSARMALPSPLPPDFARSTALHVRKMVVAPLPGAGWLGHFNELWNHPLRQLVAPARRRKLKIGLTDLVKFFCLFGIPAFLLAALRDAAPLMTFLTVAGLGLLVGIPLRHFSAEVTLLGSLRRGRCLEEIAGTGISSASIVDALATQGLGELIKAFLPVLPVLLVGAMALPEGYRGLALEVATDWLPAGVLLFIFGSYASQFLLAWSGATAPVIGLSTVVFGPPLLLLALGGMEPTHLLLKLAGGALWVAVLARGLAIWALENPARIETWSKRGVLRRDRSRNRWLAMVSDNPITRRELSRVSAAVPQGVAGIFLWRASMIVAPVLWGLWASTRIDHWASTFWSGVALFSVIIFVRSALRTLPSIVHERERGSWESLLQTRLEVGTFVRGWLEVSLYTVMVESFFAVFTLILFGLMLGSGPGDGVRPVLLAALTMLGASLVGSMVGLALSASCTTIRQAGAGLVSFVLKASVLWLLAWGLNVAVCLPFVYDDHNANWVELVQHDAPLAAEVMVGMAMWLWSWRTLRKYFAEAHQQAKVKSVKNYPASAIPLELSSLGIITYVVAVGVFLWGGLLGGDSVDPLRGSFALLLVVVMWAGLVRLPLVSLAELLAGRPGSLVVGGVYGLLAGSSFPLMVMTIDSMMRDQSSLIKRASWLPETSVALAGCSIVVGVAGGLLMGMLSRKAEPVLPERARSLRLRLVISASLAVTVFGGIFLWGWKALSTPLNNPAETARILRDSRARSQASLATPDMQNGFAILRTLLTDRDSTPDWKPFSESYSGAAHSRARLAQELTKKDVIEAQILFQRFLPQLERALAAPTFVVPFQLDLAQRFPNFIRMRQVAQGLAGLGFFYESQGRMDEALRCYELGLEWGDKGSGGGLLIQEMISIAMEAISLHRLLSLETHQTLTAAQYRRLIARVEATRFHPENLTRTVENELTSMWTFMDLPSPERARVEARLGLPLPALFVHHQQVVVANTLQKWMPALGSLAVSDLRAIELNGGVSDPLAPVAKVFLPNLNRAALQYASTLTQLEAVRVIAALHLYHLETGRWPASLNELVGHGLTTAPVCYTSPDRRFVYEVRQGQPSLKAPGLLSHNRSKGKETLMPYYDDEEATTRR